MRLRSLYLLSACLLLASATAVSPSSARDTNHDLRQQVMAVERAFAATMKTRDFAGFTRFLAQEAVFLSPQGTLRGKAAIVRAWRPYYDKPQAPFSWEPEQVEVVDSGTLAYSGGPVFDASGQRIGRFNSIWRLKAPGQWEVVFDRGSDFAPTAPRR